PGRIQRNLPGLRVEAAIAPVAGIIDTFFGVRPAPVGVAILVFALVAVAPGRYEDPASVEVAILEFALVAGAAGIRNDTAMHFVIPVFALEAVAVGKRHGAAPVAFIILE